MVCLKFLTIVYFEIRRLISKGDFVGSNFKKFGTSAHDVNIALLQ